MTTYTATVTPVEDDVIPAHAFTVEADDLSAATLDAMFDLSTGQRAQGVVVSYTTIEPGRFVADLHVDGEVTDTVTVVLTASR